MSDYWDDEANELGTAFAVNFVNVGDFTKLNKKTAATAMTRCFDILSRSENELQELIIKCEKEYWDELVKTWYRGPEGDYNEDFLRGNILSPATNYAKDWVMSILSKEISKLYKNDVEKHLKKLGY
jgi:hypothetical protein